MIDRKAYEKVFLSACSKTDRWKPSKKIIKEPEVGEHNKSEESKADSYKDNETQVHVKESNDKEEIKSSNR